MPASIQLPEPCPADWNTMTPEGEHRHCQQCCKTVVDFTCWELPDILAYLRTNTGTCGRFRKDQLNVSVPQPEEFVHHINRSLLSFPSRIAAIIIFVFGIMAASCNNGKDMAPDKVTGGLQAPVDTAVQKMDTSLLGEPAALPPEAPATKPLPPKKKKASAVPSVAQPSEEYMGGTPVIEENPEIQK